MHALNVFNQATIPRQHLLGVICGLEERHSWYRGLQSARCLATLVTRVPVQDAFTKLRSLLPCDAILAAVKVVCGNVHTRESQSVLAQ